MGNGTFRRVGMILLWMPLLALLFPLFPIVLYVTFAGGSVNIPMGFGGLSFSYRGRRQATYGQELSRRLPLSSRMIGLDLEFHGYHHIADIDYPLLPVVVGCYMRGSRVPGSSAHPSS